MLAVTATSPVLPAFLMNTPKDEWIQALVAFAAQKYEEEPVPIRQQFTAEEEQQCRIIGGHLITWLKKWGPPLIQERNVLAETGGWGKDPHVVFLTTGSGLAAASEILSGAEEQITWLTPEQFEEFTSTRPDDGLVHHCVLESWFEPAPAEEDDKLRAEYAQGRPGTLWMHRDHTIMGPLFTRGGYHLWLYDDGKMHMVEEAFRSWLS